MKPSSSLTAIPILLAGLMTGPAIVQPAHAQDAADLEANLDMLEEACGKRYSDTLSDGDHSKYYCIDAYQHYCMGNAEGVEINCRNMRGFKVEDRCAVCSWERP